MAGATPQIRDNRRVTMAALLMALSKGGTARLVRKPTPYLDSATELRCIRNNDLYI
ncbi:MAG TPA: hypothetical protein VGV87_24230 [Blastocatellia bacterium]|jgi:hypothetical protein|nr:hypothetical protein [Blastocatellia bacterium]